MKKLTGFTLIEMVMVIAIIGVLAAAVSPIALESFQAYDAASTTAITLDKLRYASERMSYEIRELSPGSITTMNDTTFAFKRVDYFSVPNSQSSVTVTIAQSSDQKNVTLTYDSPTVDNYIPVLTDQLYQGTATTSCQKPGLRFSYLDSAYAATISAANVRYIAIDLTLVATVAGSVQLYCQHTLVALRNQ